MHRIRALTSFCVIGWALALGARVHAQDVSMSAPTYVYPDNPPDKPPAPKHALHPRFPDELLKTDELGYVSEEVFVDSRGKVLSVNMHGTVDAYMRELNKQEGTRAEGGSWEFTAALRAGKPVNSLIHFAVVYNPASAAPDKPDATVRLLDARTIADPKWTLKEGDKGLSQRLVWATVSIDERGQPTGVKGIEDAAAALLLRDLGEWRFAPARQSGHAVASEVRVPFIIVPADTGIGRNGTPPRVIRQERPQYPRSMRMSKMRGEVLVDFVVDIEGHVIRAFVVRSLNPAFDAPALESVRKWLFEPARNNGVPVYTHMQVPIYFQLDFVADGGSSGIDVRDTGDDSKLPEELRVDVQPKIRSIVIAVYPYELLRDDVRGSSQVGYVVDTNGIVAASRVIKASRPEFGFALQAAVERFEYEAALKKGRPNKALLGFEQDFRTSDGTLVSDADGRLLRLETKHPERIAKASSLDAPLKPLVRQAPVFPRSLIGHAPHGEALVELLVDEDGHPRLPRVVSASQPAFGYAAVQAAALWQFTRPLSKGSAVVTRVRVPFAFESP